MKPIFRSMIACILLSVVASASGLLPASFSPVPPAGQYLRPGQSCTVFYGSDGEVVLGGNNEDFINPLTYVWFVPAQKGSYGQVYFGFDDGIPQGAVNDQGLFYDGLSLPFKAVQASAKPVPLDRYAGLIEEIFATASTVEQVEEIFSRYNVSGLETAQLLFGDRSGHSIIIDGDTITPKDGDFQVATNFRLADYASAPPSVDRFDTATRMLSSADRFSVDLFRQVLDATHQEGPAPTQYSQVYDLKNNRITLYHFHDFATPVVLDIAKELAKGPHSSPIAALFPANADREAFALQPVQQYQAKSQALVDAEIDPDRFVDFVGEYRNTTNPGEPSTRIFLESGTLYAAKTGRPASQLYPVGEDAFVHPYFYGGEQLNIHFLRDGAGRVTGADAVLSAEAFGLAQSYHLDPVKNSSSQLLWILAAVVGVGLAAAGVFIRVRKLQNRRE